MKKVIPPYIFCVRCGEKVELIEEEDEKALAKIREQGYTAVGRGICRCGVVYVLCYQPLPASPTFSLFFNIYQPEALQKILE